MKFNIVDGVLISCEEFKKKDTIIIIPSNVNSIGTAAFKDNEYIKKVIIPSSVKSIGDLAFFNCKKLETISLEDGVNKIGYRAFYNCEKLKEIILPNSIFSIEKEAFFNCKNLHKVVFPNMLKELKENVFYSCGLQDVILPDSLKTIEFRALYTNGGFNTLVIPKNIEKIHNISLPLHVENLVINCDDFELMRTVVLPYSPRIEIKNYNNLYIPSVYNLTQSHYESRVYKNKKTGNIVISLTDENSNDLEKINFSIPLHDGLDKVSAIAYACMPDKMELGNKYLDFLGNGIILKNVMKQKSDYGKFMSTLINRKEYHDIYKKIKFDREENEYNFFKFLYNLGAFDDNYLNRQKATEFVLNIIDKGIASIDNFYFMFDSMNLDGFNEEWASFIMNKNNFKVLFEKEKEINGYIAKTYNRFFDIKEFTRSNRGGQNYKLVTPEICDKYFFRQTFKGVNDLNEDIVEEIKKYSSDQETFDEANKIREEYLTLKREGKIQDHILNMQIKEKDVFVEINELKKNIKDDIKTINKNLNIIANKKFTYEFLNKYDPRNFVLGKYCSCCSHLEGSGFGIMKAGILHPDCQNLVLRDSSGKIIAKSTLYINREQGYGVFNNIEINNSINEEDKKIIYLKYKEAITRFAHLYNMENKDKPLKQINVGMTSNDLSELIKNKEKKAEVILEGINFALYGKKNQNYKGDWQLNQYILWQKKSK